MQMNTVLKVNLLGKGYTHIWVDTPPVLELKVLDELLPPIDNRASLPVAYSAKLLSPNQVFIAVGIHWPYVSDEGGRKGLSFWHGILFKLPNINDQHILAISNILIGLMYKYEFGYTELGKLIEDLATEKQPDDWATSFVRLTKGLPSRITTEAENLVYTFWANYDWTIEYSNFRVTFPFHPYLAIPCLMGVLLHNSRKPQIAGGMLPQSGLDRFQYISSPKDVPQYQAINFSDVLVQKKLAFQLPSRVKLTNKKIIYIVVAIVFILYFIILFKNLF